MTREVPEPLATNIRRVVDSLGWMSVVAHGESGQRHSYNLLHWRDRFIVPPKRLMMGIEEEATT